MYKKKWTTCLSSPLYNDSINQINVLYSVQYFPDLSQSDAEESGS